MDETMQDLIPAAEDLSALEESEAPEAHAAPAEPGAPNPPAETAAAPGAPARDFFAEAELLLAEHPELRGSALPDEVVRSAVEDGVPLTEAYRTYFDRETQAELRRLREENRVYRQNAEAAARAPVQGVANTGAETKPTDPFLAGFESW